MKELITKYFKPKYILISFAVTLETILFSDIIISFVLNIKSPVWLVPVTAVLLFLLFLLLFKSKGTKCILAVIAVIPIIFALFTAVHYNFVYKPFVSSSVYSDKTAISSEFFKGKKVMVVVPHEDDDINLTGGAIDVFVENGCEVYPVFITNGDYHGLGEVRINEAIKCWGDIGVPEENVIFMGYGDQYQKDGPHIYNAKGDRVVTSIDNRTKTYGTAGHKPYNDNADYTYNNYKSDLVSIISTVKPDVIFASDFDYHPDHMAASMIFETAMGEVLSSDKTYKPFVYKGYAYGTSWYAPNDYYSVNILKTVKPNFDEKFPAVYEWQSRLRLPVTSKALSRSMIASSVYKLLEDYESQDALIRAGKIINSDKVFWQRRTDSLLYRADISVSSGKGDCLNDFLLLDSDEVKDLDHFPDDGVWIPDKTDSEKAITIKLKSKSYIDSIVLYDNPSAKDNVSDIRITFDNGEVLNTGKLKENGSATVVKVNKNAVSSFTVTVVSSEGKRAGLSEIEAYSDSAQLNDSFIKLKDADDNFAYDYFTDIETSEFSLYSNNDVPALSEEYYEVACDNGNCAAEISDNKLKVTCPKGEECLITVTLKNTDVSDTFIVRNIGSVQMFNIRLSQFMEQSLYYPIKSNQLYRLATLKLIYTIIT